METKKCNPLNCGFFANIATRPTRGIKKGETLPPPTIEQTTPVDKIVVNCPYRKKLGTCLNDKETLKVKKY